MKKVSKIVISSILLFSLAIPAVDAASVTMIKTSSNVLFKTSSTFQGTGKYQKFTCTISGSSGAAGDCSVLKLDNKTIPASLDVGEGYSRPNSRSVDVFLDKGATYQIQARVDGQTAKGDQVVANINN